MCVLIKVNGSGRKLCAYIKDMTEKLVNLCEKIVFSAYCPSANECDFAFGNDMGSFGHVNIP